MSLELFMIGLVAQNMEKSLDFYRRLGLAIPEGNEGQAPVGMKMKGEFTLLLSPNTIERDHLESGGAPNDLRVFFEYYVQSQAAVEAKYAELVGHGYQSYRAPFQVRVGIPVPSEMCFALVKDPDGNAILLSGDAETT